MGEIARLQHTTERLSVFQGTNLRRERTSLPDEDVARAINCDLHTQVGTALLRRGRTLVYSLPLAASGRMRLQDTFVSARYNVTGTVLYKNGTSLLTGLSGTLRTSLLAMRPLQDTTTWTFIADLSGLRKEVGGTVRTWGIAPPGTAPVLAAGAAGALSGVYNVSYTYVRLDGTAVAHESNPSPTSLDVTVTATTISVSGLTASTDPQVTHKRLYRTVNGGSTRLFDQQITNATTTATLSVADTGLGSAVATDNDRPSLASVAVLHQEHVFLLDPANPDYLWWSKRFRPESVPTTNFLRIGSSADPLHGLVSLVGLLGVFTLKTKYRVLGNDTSGFVHQEALSSRGTPAPQAALVTEKGCLFVARDGLFRTNFVQEDEELSGLIAPLFEGLTVNDYLPINWDAASTMALAYWKQRLYFAYPSGDATSPDMLAVYSFHTSQWYFYQMTADALYSDEASDQLWAGLGTDITALESGAGDLGQAITMTLEPASRSFQAPFVRKRFDYLRVDATIPSGSLLCEIYLDERLVQYVLLTGTRTRRLLRLHGLQGFTWRVRLTYTGTADVQIHGVEMQAVALRAA